MTTSVMISFLPFHTSSQKLQNLLLVLSSNFHLSALRLVLAKAYSGKYPKVTYCRLIYLLHKHPSFSLADSSRLQPLLSWLPPSASVVSPQTTKSISSLESLQLSSELLELCWRGLLCVLDISVTLVGRFVTGVNV